MGCQSVSEGGKEESSFWRNGEDIPGINWYGVPEEINILNSHRNPRPSTGMFPLEKKNTKSGANHGEGP